MKIEHTHMTEVAGEAARIARSITTDQLGLPTPCGDWDLRELINHWVLYTSHGLEHRALGKDLPDELTTRDFTADADWAQQYAAQLDRAVAAWSDPAVWDGEVDLGNSTTPAAETAAMLIEETALHTWDVARAVGEELRLSDAAAAYVLDVVDGNAALYRQYDGFADEVTVPGSASLLQRALARSGRDPHWARA
ncbi:MULTISPECIES: TIGR03086 family metal-binding protein [unclassified Streptomyces]|uniref:TIGR03086 family metal-binding protein n=1 Tax=unclassified Streptomyces TaxID=2593676 RepID=UPI002258EE89|nr:MULTISPECIES: TIGR03086 family metal-binding protein [unclassified Streptomyces]WSP58371.1 TIGR03086 family metal-binding protein [Streptomyces sp. NBC_01241]WSU21054.1 TIGR03086 family metal-binding protein [Streptomyces sp. NBC_01108]MCX4790125.1 TIGR03086 family metal-binding protein [Streptomyces sp. NBC_01221]MCX4794148.1 TIGR03086 family metal-binding protein [Streptomyces sp. NBC_01242]WSJ35547.1 TIGR03086 family metal-binding protein [Streptomyces sp. NBC_01321]